MLDSWLHGLTSVDACVVVWRALRREVTVGLFALPVLCASVAQWVTRFGLRYLRAGICGDRLCGDASQTDIHTCGQLCAQCSVHNGAGICGADCVVAAVGLR
jgi:hypothetical protein